MGCEEGACVVGNPSRSVCLARPRRDEGGELGVRHADARGQVRGHRVQQGGDDSGLSTVQPFEAVQPDIGRAEFRPLDAVADPLQGREHLPEDPAVVRLIGVQHDGVRVKRQGLFQRYPRPNVMGCWKIVDHHRPLPRRTAVDDQDWAVPQVRMPLHLRLRPEVSDEYAGDSHGASSTRWYGTVDSKERTFCCQPFWHRRGKCSAPQALTEVQRCPML